ncbi:helix-turn-helix transcriptional regulator [Mycolicibacter senuensis]|uniref:Transcriptional regulator n=1 Tax=Mycolicibacter senuensis TaxID=386913 RepID=A0A7I9XH59_9MYCO|nr:metalloregulator ArsR/SmtB family transcription factor [Mycolicibacter senuensis]ORW65715.1 DNA-binding protein [Mycolicibacter senuensis]GFG69313.1 transcriptional regulator [Mycolicibacter senuensis]
MKFKAEAKAAPQTAGQRPGGAVSAAPQPAADLAGSHDSPEGRTRQAVVRLLMESGSITAGDIGAQLGLSAAGVRRHLDALIEMGDAEAHAAASWQQVGRGRPAKRYQLTEAGRGKLGHRYDDLAVAAMRQLREIGGEDAVVAFARQRIDSILSEVAAVAAVGDPDTDGDLEATAERIAAALTEAGYVASTARVDGGVPGVQILQHHCPVANVAKEFPELCRAERQAMAEVLGTHVQRLATIADGGYVCTTHVPLTIKSTTSGRAGKTTKAGRSGTAAKKQ